MKIIFVRSLAKMPQTQFYPTGIMSLHKVENMVDGKD